MSGKAHRSTQAQGPVLTEQGPLASSQSNAALAEQAGPEAESPGFLGVSVDSLNKARRGLTALPKSNDIATQATNVHHVATGGADVAMKAASRAFQAQHSPTSMAEKTYEYLNTSRSTAAANNARPAGALGKGTRAAGKALAPLAIAGGAVNMAEAGHTLSENSAYSDKGADAVVQMGEGALGVAGGVATLAGSSAAPLVGSAGAGVMLGRRGNKRLGETGIFGADTDGSNRSASDWLGDSVYEDYETMKDAGANEYVAGGVAAIGGIGKLAGAGALAAGAGIVGVGEDLCSGVSDLASWAWGD